MHSIMPPNRHENSARRCEGHECRHELTPRLDSDLHFLKNVTVAEGPLDDLTAAKPPGCTAPRYARSHETRQPSSARKAGATASGLERHLGHFGASAAKRTAAKKRTPASKISAKKGCGTRRNRGHRASECPGRMAERYAEFSLDLPRICTVAHLDRRDLTFLDYRTLVAACLAKNEW